MRKFPYFLKPTLQQAILLLLAGLFIFSPIIIFAGLIAIDRFLTAQRMEIREPNGLRSIVVYNTWGDPLDANVWRYELHGPWPWQSKILIDDCSSYRTHRLYKWVDKEHFIVEILPLDKGEKTPYRTVDIKAPKVPCE